jgi:DNA-binding HxlR family transcriptional regulator
MVSTWSEERVAPVLRLLAYKWTLPILRELSAGQLRRVDLLHLTKMPDRTLTTTVRALERAGLVDVHLTGGVPARTDLTLTADGRSVLQLLARIDTWSRRHMPPPA